MQSVCRAQYIGSLRSLERKFIVDSLLLPRINIDPYAAFPFFILHEDLAKKCVTIDRAKGSRSITEDIDMYYGKALVAFSKKLLRPLGEYKDLDDAAALYCLGPRWPFLRDLLHNDHPAVILDKVRDFYEEAKPSSFEWAFTVNEFRDLAEEIDVKAEQIYYRSFLDFPRVELPSLKLFAAGRCVSALAATRLFSTHGYAYLESLPDQFFNGYTWVFKKLAKSLAEEDIRLFKQLRKASVADRTLKLVLEEKIGSLSTLVGFEPLDPLKLLENLPDPFRDIEKAVEMRKEMDGAIHEILKNISSLRKLFEKVHHKCFEGDIEQAADAKKKLLDAKPSESMNRIILKNLRQFSRRKVVRELEHELDTELGRKEDITRIAGYFGDVRLTVSGLILAATSLGVTEELGKFLEATSVGLLIPGAAARILKSAIPILPGFDIYATFHKWPKAS